MALDHDHQDVLEADAGRGQVLRTDAGETERGPVINYFYFLFKIYIKKLLKSLWRHHMQL